MSLLCKLHKERQLARASRLLPFHEHDPELPVGMAAAANAPKSFGWRAAPARHASPTRELSSVRSAAAGGGGGGSSFKSDGSASPPPAYQRGRPADSGASSTPHNGSRRHRNHCCRRCRSPARPWVLRATLSPQPRTSRPCTRLSSASFPPSSPSSPPALLIHLFTLLTYYLPAFGAYLNLEVIRRIRTCLIRGEARRHTCS